MRMVTEWVRIELPGRFVFDAPLVSLGIWSAVGG
jgi:hypothetical protein